MAINAYAGIRAQSISATVSTNGVATPQTIYLSDRIGQLQPMLRTPNILDLISNNSFTGGDSSQLVNLRFYWNQKAGTFDLLADETGTIKRGQTLVATQVPVLATQVFPVSYGKKMDGDKRDLQLEGLENVISVKIADAILDFRNDVLTSLLKKANNSAIATQLKVIDSTTGSTTDTTFTKGAHYVQTTYADGAAIYKDLKNAVAEFLRMGMDSSASKYNKNIQYMRGCTKRDLLILIDEKIAGDLFELPGLWSSNNAFTELFKNGEFRDFLGVAIMPTPWLPAGTNFMILTMGSPYGALHYSLCGELIKSFSGEAKSAIGSTVIVKDDPAWAFSYIIDMMENYRADVLLPDLIWVSSQNAATPITKKVNILNKNKKSLDDLSMQHKILTEKKMNNIASMDNAKQKLQLNSKTLNSNEKKKLWNLIKQMSGEIKSREHELKKIENLIEIKNSEEQDQENSGE